jgi:hypothetical protein
MLIEFSEELDLPVENVYPYFGSPKDWTRLYGAFGDVEERGDGWFAVPLRRFPFPLVARITVNEPLKRVAWEFRGFWRGGGEVAFEPMARGVRVTGYERISIGPLLWFSPIVERLFLERRFKAIWESGWRRLSRGEAS